MPRIRIKSKRGGAKKLGALEKTLEDAPDVLKAISRNSAEEVVGLIKDGFRDEKDPYGKRWKPKQIPDGRKVLSGKTSNLKGGWHVTSSSKGGFTVAPSVDYAVHHQFGAPRAGIPQRMMVPSKARGLPAGWADALEEVAKEELSAHFSLGLDLRTGPGIIEAKFAGLKRRLGIKSIVKKIVKSVVD